MKSVILIAEEDDLTRLTLTYMLEAMGHIVAGVAKSEQMFGILEALRFDILLVSLGGNGFSGYNIAANAKSCQPDIKVIAADLMNRPGFRGGRLV